MGEQSQNTLYFTRQFIRVLRDALIAHTDAYNKAGILHREVGAANILVTGDSGLLIDWALSESEVRRRERKGTWQFMSSELILFGFPSCYSLQDDLESFFHALSWTSLKHAKPETVHGTTCLFPEYDHVFPFSSSDRALGGEEKQIKMENRALRSCGFVDSAFIALLFDFEDTCAARYELNPDLQIIEEMRQLYAPLPLEKQEKVFARIPEYRTYTNRKRLESGQWFIDRCNEAMKSDDWPPPQARVENTCDRKNPATISISSTSSVDDQDSECPSETSYSRLGDSVEIRVAYQRWQLKLI
ncbi:hypothetical protein K435DRAFT_860885 [Dendrothele bispora CBS 962.96]|uniref:Fungal-type protein kinase domain-containing protein n=1 Tax=Dendrothele bispora (strain CBS 962.96) TaxID=1314807 RepID=A0A4S8LWW8_DENBC|nr:hypothetical protein K435DRAFT_860885 [Dendrothele bispora CBS 962.96]